MKGLPRITRATLSQLRSGWFRRLNIYHSKIEKYLPWRDHRIHDFTSWYWALVQLSYLSWRCKYERKLNVTNYIHVQQKTQKITFMIKSLDAEFSWNLKSTTHHTVSHSQYHPRKHKNPNIVIERVNPLKQYHTRSSKTSNYTWNSSGHLSCVIIAGGALPPPNANISLRNWKSNPLSISIMPFVVVRRRYYVVALYIRYIYLTVIVISFVNTNYW